MSRLSVIFCDTARTFRLASNYGLGPARRLNSARRSSRDIVIDTGRSRAPAILEVGQRARWRTFARYVGVCKTGDRCLAEISRPAVPFVIVRDYVQEINIVNTWLYSDARACICVCVARVDYIVIKTYC